MVKHRWNRSGRGTLKSLNFSPKIVATLCTASYDYDGQWVLFAAANVRRLQ